MGHSSDRDPEPFSLWKMTDEQTRDSESSLGANWSFHSQAWVGMAFNLKGTHKREHTDSSLGAQERGEPVSQKIVFMLEKTGLEVDSKEIGDAHGRARGNMGCSSLTHGKCTEKAKNPRKDLLTRTVPYLEMLLPETAQPDTMKNFSREKLNGASSGSGHMAQEEKE